MFLAYINGLIIYEYISSSIKLFVDEHIIYREIKHNALMKEIYISSPMLMLKKRKAAISFTKMRNGQDK